jgi:hypothetical protein
MSWTERKIMGLNFEAMKKGAGTCDVFLETGSYKGDGIQFAFDVGFKRVISIELGGWAFGVCTDRFRDKIASGQLILVQGDSLAMMPELIKMAGNDRIMFYLDAHHYDDVSAIGEKWCPLVEEINAIRDSGRKDHVIMVDDITCAQKGEFMFPPEKEILDALLQVNPEYRMTYEDCTIRPKDLLIAWPKDIV